MNIGTAVSLILSLYFAGTASKHRLGIFNSNSQYYPPHDKVIRITCQNVLQCVDKCFRHAECNAVIQHYGSNSTCSLLIIGNEGSVNLNESPMDLDPDSVIWVRQLQHKKENNSTAITHRQNKENEAPATTNEDQDQEATASNSSEAATTNEDHDENATTNATTNNNSGAAATTAKTTLSTMGDVTMATTLTCLYPFTSASTGCYYVENVVFASWNEARNNCQGMNPQPSGPDADLVSPDTAEVYIAPLYFFSKAVTHQ